MKVLVVGGGGREHTIAWKLAESPHVDTVYAAPGNAGISGIGDCFPVGAEDKKALLDLAVEKQVDLTVVGPEAPLVSGITDLFRSEGQRIFGFDSRGALLEGSKVWAKQFMEKYEIPTGGFAVFGDHCAAQNAVGAGKPPFVIKADGLAAGKGVLICRTLEEVRDAIETVMQKKQFGAAGERVIFEEFLEGPELSVIAIFDGKPNKNMRMIGTYYQNPGSYAVRTNSKYKTIEDLKGARVPSDYTSGRIFHYLCEAILATAGMNHDDFVKVPVPNFVAGVNAFIQGRADAAYIPLNSGIGKKAMASIRGGWRFIDFDGYGGIEPS